MYHCSAQNLTCFPQDPQKQKEFMALLVSRECDKMVATVSDWYVRRIVTPLSPSEINKAALIASSAARPLYSKVKPVLDLEEEEEEERSKANQREINQLLHGFEKQYKPMDDFRDEEEGHTDSSNVVWSSQQTTI
jgi:cation transport regulator ChaB